MTTLARLAAFAILPGLALALVGCTPGGGTGTGATGDDGGTAGGGSLTCDGATTEGYELFVDPRLGIEPQQDVYSLAAGDSIAFTDVPEADEDVYTTYSYTLAYINDEGTVFPNTGGIFVGAEDTREWTLDGPVTASGISGGPFAAFVDIEATTGDGTTTIARICATLPAS